MRFKVGQRIRTIFPHLPDFDKCLGTITDTDFEYLTVRLDCKKNEFLFKRYELTPIEPDYIKILKETVL